jgi:glycosyltransferase involved in cell wall biosynthesis
VSITTSVVVPSFRRHQEVLRAVKSALNQTVPPLEVIVANDGPDADKARLLAELGDGRVRYVEAPRRGNASATRNFGVRHARGDWIALLDDDDIWLPGKLEAQFAALKRSRLSQAILAGVEVVYAQGKRCHVRPARSVPLHTPVDELLFCGYGGAHTSTLMAPKWAFEKYPFDEEQERHEDWSWMLHAGQELELVMAPEETCERYLTPSEGLSRPGGYAFSRQWYAQHKALMSARVRASFVSNILSRKAAYDRKISALPWLLGELGRNAGLHGRSVARLATPWLVPARARQAIKAMKASKADS